MRLIIATIDDALDESVLMQTRYFGPNAYL